MSKIWPSWARIHLKTDLDASQRIPSDDSHNHKHAANKEKPAADGIARQVIHDETEQKASASVVENAGKRELTLGEGWESTGFAFSTWRKWSILTSVFIVQISMNYNASAYANAVSGLTEEYAISNFQARLGQMVFLVAYAIGCEAWAPWSEELGRYWVLQGSLFLVNIFQIPCALSTNWTTVIVARGLGGLSSAGGSVTLGIVADMWQPESQQYAISFVVLSSVAGSLVGPIFGGFIETYLSFRWVFWIQLIFGAATQAFHFFVATETNTDTLLDREARKRRRYGTDSNIYGPQEIKGTLWQRLSWKRIGTLMWRPYRLLLTEPIVGFLSLLSGFSDALIFTGLSSFPLVLKKWNFSTINVGLAFIGLLVGYLLAYFAYMLHYWQDDKRKAASVRGPDLFTPERRLYLLLFLVLLEPIGLLGFAFTSFGPPHGHWIAPIIFTIPIGIANYAIYQATIDYMVAAYGSYSASATGGNGFCRDALAGFAALYAEPMYRNIATGTKWQLVAPSLILAGIGAALCAPVFVFYFHGLWFRERSKFAQSIEAKRQEELSVATAAKVDRTRETTDHEEVVAANADSYLRSTEV